MQQMCKRMKLCFNRKGMFMVQDVLEIFIYVFILAGLILEVVEDVTEKKIWMPVIVIELPVLLGVNYWLGKGGILLLIASFGIGGFFYLISVLTKEQIGKGDAFIFCMTGAGLGMIENLLLIYITFLLAFFVAIFLWGIKRVGKKYSMPLMPFVLCAYMVVMGLHVTGFL